MNNQQSQETPEKDEQYIGNIWGWRNSMIALIIILIVIGIALCRYVMIKPERFIMPEKIEKHQ
jgi:predicted MFS family arabinose efflux permease